MQKHGTDTEKLEALYYCLADDEAEGVFSEWEMEFIDSLYLEQQEVDKVLSEKQSLKLDELYEKAWKASIIDTEN